MQEENEGEDLASATRNELYKSVERERKRKEEGKVGGGIGLE